MESYEIENYEFLTYDIDNGIEVGFSTAKNNLNFNKNLIQGRANLNNLKKWFQVNEIVYLNQVHGTKVYCYDGDVPIVDSDGDGIVTKEKNVAIGVFTADCVPIILVDIKNKVIAALHSGWKGTLNNITSQGIKVMKENYDCDENYIKAFIGPHNKRCCYEVSKELIYTFKNCDLFKNQEINFGRNLDLQRCVEIQLINAGIKNSNIVCLNLCTHCSNKKLYSYRKKEESHGRLFSFIFIHELKE
jgi:YfiH family protein